MEIPREQKIGPMMTIKFKPVEQKSELREYFLRSYHAYECLFACIKSQAAFYTRPQPLRHPLIFYYGHTAVLYVNKAIEAGFLKQQMKSKLETVFAVGVDQQGWDDLLPSHYDWPTIQQTKQYRDQVKQVMLDIIDRYNGQFGWQQKGWGLLMGVEHELIHLQTSAVIIRRLPIEYVRSINCFPVCQQRQQDIDKVPINSLENISAYQGKHSMLAKNLKRYAWDNETGELIYDVKPFKASKYLVSNGEFYRFMEDNGYHQQQFWSKEGWFWRSDKDAQMPLFWVVHNGKYFLRTLCEQIKMPWDWPVIVNHLEAHAFCNWKSKKHNQTVRLPTEGEYEAMLSTIRQHPQTKANLAMEFASSEMPVNKFKSTSGLYDVIGNVWQHLWTIFYPYEQFTIHPYYEDYSTPAFDEKHNLMRGGSWITHGSLAEIESRNFFRRHFYQFAGFRYVQSNNPAPQIIKNHICDESLAFNTRVHYRLKDNYLTELYRFIIDSVKQTGSNVPSDKCLIVGCSAGRLPFQLSNQFKESIGLDNTSRYFRVATLLQQQGIYTISSQQDDNGEIIRIGDLGLPQYKKVQFFQQKPDNIDDKKFNSFDLIVIDNFALNDGMLFNSAKKIHHYIKPEGYLVINTASPLNSKVTVDTNKLKELLATHFECVVSKPTKFIVKKNGNDVTVHSELSLWRLRSTSSSLRAKN